jgi:tRNA pseudouridine38-40 synthase
MALMNFKLVLQYDGTDFSGWQKQPKLRTIQEELERALSKLFDDEIAVVAAGRTDAGVHAAGQVVSFASDKARSLASIHAGLNSLLPESVSVTSVQRAKADFNARFDAVTRHYRYQIVRRNEALRSRYAWCEQTKLNVQDMQTCSRAIIGEHDFQSFCSTDAEVNHYHCFVKRAVWRYAGPNLLVFTIAADRFLYNMVRILVGTMVEVGRERFTPADFLRMLKSKDRRSAGLTAPAKGLCLTQVDYDHTFSEDT